MDGYELRVFGRECVCTKRLKLEGFRFLSNVKSTPQNTRLTISATVISAPVEGAESVWRNTRNRSFSPRCKPLILTGLPFRRCRLNRAVVLTLLPVIVWQEYSQLTPPQHASPGPCARIVMSNPRDDIHIGAMPDARGIGFNGEGCVTS